MNHTPGPWNIAYGSLIVGPDREGVADCNARGAVPVSQPEMAANAHLIAAAPQLYAALVELLSVSSPCGFCWGAVDMKRVLDAAQAAIERAEGKKP